MVSLNLYSFSLAFSIPGPGGSSFLRVHGVVTKLCLERERDVAQCSVRLWCDVSSDRSFMIDSFMYFSFQPELNDW